MVFTFGTVTIFICDVANFNFLSLWGNVAVTSLSDLSTVFLVTTFVNLNSVPSWIAVLIASVVRHFIFIRCYGYDISVGLIRVMLVLMLIMVSLVLIILPKCLWLHRLILLLIKVVITLKESLKWLNIIRKRHFNANLLALRSISEVDLSTNECRQRNQLKSDKNVTQAAFLINSLRNLPETFWNLLRLTLMLDLQRLECY